MKAVLAHGTLCFMCRNMFGHTEAFLVNVLGRKKGKIDVCCMEVWRGEQHMADTAFPNM